MSYELIILLSILIHQQDNDDFQAREEATAKLTTLVQKRLKLRVDIKYLSSKKGISPEARYRNKQVCKAAAEAELEQLAKHVNIKIPGPITGYKLKGDSIEYPNYECVYIAAIAKANENSKTIVDYSKVSALIEEVYIYISVKEYIKNSKNEGMPTEQIIKSIQHYEATQKR